MIKNIVGVAAVAFALGLVGACSSEPEFSEGGPNNFGGANGGDGDSGSGGDINDIDLGGGMEGSGGDGKGHTCKTACEAGECGPIADGCGDLIECGGCTAPETCGGGKVPSQCGGAAACVPKTCDELGFSCGLQADGCGGELDCWSDDARETDGKKGCADASEACVDGTCTTISSCTPKTCDDYADEDEICGPVGDGCGGTLDCGFSCSEDEVCGAVEPSKCGTATCEPKSCDEALANEPSGFCGFVADGCGGEIADCATSCQNGETCGGGGVADVCGKGVGTCVPRTAADCGSTTCGFISDGCGGTVSCGGCNAPETCGGGGVAGQCGAPICSPKTCDDFNAECGSVADGCGGTIASCGSCDDSSVCNANHCEAIVCTPRTKEQVCDGLCGVQSDGCGGTVSCGGCTAPNSCGGGGTPNVCGAPTCVPRTCNDVGANCGPIGDGCGGIIDSCGTCESGELCGAQNPSQCGVPDSECTGLCENQVPCSSGSETRLSGKVYAPNGSDPLYNALVYVPNAPLPSIGTGPSCERCEDEDLGSPIAAAISGPDGSFVLRNVPAGVDFPLVVKMGKWRRVVTIPAVSACTNVNLTVNQARLPRNMTDASAENQAYVNIPQFAMVTGDVDEIECVLRKIGISDSEFTRPSGNGRIHMYRQNGAGMCTNLNGSGTWCRSSGRHRDSQSALYQNNALDDYDVAIFGCEGSANDRDGYDQALREWANRGGRIFASHYSYKYLDDNGDFATTATWGGNWNDNGNQTTGIVDTSSSKGQAFDDWLGHVNAHHPTHGEGYITIDDPRSYVKANAVGTERFVYTDEDATVGGQSINAESAVQQYSFNTPVGASSENVCGRVLYSAFHVANASGNNDDYFPLHCDSGPLSAQEKVLMFMIFDLSACVSNPPTVGCEPTTCAEAGANCGYLADGCGGLLDCGGCSAPDSCGGAGTPNVCGTGCTQTTCGAEGANCGVIGDGCGGTLDCGSCTAPAACGASGTANVCGVPQCTPRSCADVGAECGALADGCGGVLQCGSCENGQTCGGSGTPNTCGSGTCNPRTCALENAECGFIGDGCGGTVNCGTCSDGGVCGAAGPNLCGPGCSPRTCDMVGATCGFIGDGCGGVVDCGTCTSPQICGGGGVPSQCGGSCTPRTCADAGAACGAISDGCGGVLKCGTCPSPTVCGGSGVPNQCGSGTCTPRSCEDENAECGIVGNGCGQTLNCGTCPEGESCGGGGPNQCGSGGCIPLSCDDQNADCGPVADGCGGLLDCGSCPSGSVCGGDGVANQCSQIVH